jgi:hypothetical protein
VQHEQDPVEHRPIIQAPATRTNPPTLDLRDQLLDDHPQLVVDEHPARHRHLPGRLCPTEKFAARLHNPVLKQVLRVPSVARVATDS